jgi:hypothetical protein
VAGKGKQCRVSSILAVDSIPWVGPGNDLVFGEAGKDSVTDVFGPFFGFPADRDLLFGGPDNDFLNGLDGDNLDYLDCGAGEDNVYMADPGDTVLANCQRNIGPQ